MTVLIVGLLMLSTLFGARPAAAQNVLRVAAAADLQTVLPALSADYEKASGTKLEISYASSATLATQIMNGAPFDIFLAADYSFPEKVVAANLADTRDPTAYARGTLVLWARKDSPLQPLSMERLTDPRAQRIAIANEFHAPYGRAAVAALHWLKLYDKVEPHLVVAENIAQTAQFVETGNAQLGLISLTVAATPHFREVGTYVLVPTYAYPEIRQCAVVMTKSPHKDEAHAFLHWLLTPAVQDRLKDLGLAPVQ
ncbi:molybdate ABC transporter substrate-binding protein [Edaphobacter acidisoli]|uniref:Molybdate ABC transporter substrate-binding protein n=1 Tax=Edaphobacter acidisoli TaxID=2040573 RepID=A0A916RKL2_9BACT|nr:molybdate ABC transporter substrate-binding protein [Edaphobacter acidisoli]GGA57317.1 molybdate ABC transporter substrate-binding protein [Edaphobacter acidisoli]